MPPPDESACSSTSAADERDALLPAAPAAAARRRRRAPWRALALALSAGLCVGAARGAARWRPSRVAAAELGAARWSRHAGAAYSYAYDDDGAAREVNRSRGGDTLTDDITDDFYSFSYQSPQLGVFKRTYWSIDPFRDAKFLETFVGLKVSASQVWKMPADPFDVAATTDKDDEPYPDFDASPKHGANGTQLCAHRSVVSSLENSVSVASLVAGIAAVCVIAICAWSARQDRHFEKKDAAATRIQAAMRGRQARKAGGYQWCWRQGPAAGCRAPGECTQEGQYQLQKDKQVEAWRTCVCVRGARVRWSRSSSCREKPLGEPCDGRW